MPWTVEWVSPDLLAQHRYAAAPIKEAVLELRVECDEPTGLDALRELALSLDGWGDAQVRQMFTGSVDVRDDGAAAASTQAAGYQMQRADSARAIHILPDRVAYAWTAPYENWDTFVNEMWAVWRPFAALVQPRIISRISTRFVNVIDIPKAQVEISDYLRTTVDISSTLPQAVRGLFMQVDVPLIASGGLGVSITSTLAAPAAPDRSALVLDLDTYDQRPITVGPNTDDDVAGRLETLRSAKNYVFEASITDATRGLIS